MSVIKIKEIKWGNRRREDYGDIEELANSLASFGFIEPIVIDDENNLIAGGRRLTAAIKLGWTEIPIYRLGELSLLQRKELELEENLRRKELTWQEEADSVAEIHALKKERYGANWSVEDTAKALHVTKQTVHSKIKLHKALKTNPELKNEESFKVALTKVRRQQEAETRAILAESAPKMNFLHNDDALDILPYAVADESVDLILLDPPYGVNIDRRPTRGEGSTGSWTWAKETYNDDELGALLLMERLFGEAARVLKPGAHCYLFFGLTMLSAIQEILKPHLGFQRLPIIWAKNTHGNVDPYKRFSISYEAILFCWKGTEPRDLNSACHAVLQYPVNAKEKKHPSEKPTELYRKLISLSTVEGEMVLDPTAGSGNSVATAISMGRKIIGIERDETFFNIMRENVERSGQNA